MHMFTDNPITTKYNDTFDFITYVEVLEEVIKTTARPFCIGVFGPWGSGKSSFMRILQSSLNEEKIPTIWFNPWKYDQKEDLWNALIQTILSEISEHPLNDEVKTKIKNLARSAAWLTLKKAITAFTVSVINEANLDALAEAFNGIDETYYRHINHFEEDFTSIVKAYSKDDKLVIFIDDLDRCLPENAITVLESLKLFLNNEHCIFVVGIDHDIVEEGIKHRYEGKIALNGRDYLDKIIQIPFFLPRISHEKLQASLTTTDAIFSNEIWNIIHLAMEGNPRKTRRFINSFLLTQRFLNHPDQDLQQRLQEGSLTSLPQAIQNIYLAKILVFKMNFPGFYRHLQYNPGDWEYLEEKIVQGDTGKVREAALDKNKKLQPFWDDSAFEDFMNRTSGDLDTDYPSAPAEEVVRLLLSATDLVTDSSEI